jgi:hypothetical protein
MAISTPPTSPQVPVYYSPEQIGAGALLAGWSQAELPTVIAVALAESSGQANAIGPEVRGVGRAYGLMQIMWPLHQELFSGGIESGRWMDAATNMQMARSVYNSQGWKAWETYTNGRYRIYSGQGAAAAGSLSSSVQAAGGNVSNVANSTLGPAQSRVNLAQQAWAKALGGAAPQISSAGVLTAGPTDAAGVHSIADVSEGPTTTGTLAPIVRLLEVIGGAALIALGLYLFAKPVTDPVVKLAKQLADNKGGGGGGGATKKPAPKKKPAKKTAAPAKKKTAARPARAQAAEEPATESAKGT